MSFVRDFVASGKPVAGDLPRPLVAGGSRCDQRTERLTSYESIRTDLRNAGANVVDEEVVVNGNIITSRSPRDLDGLLLTVKEICSELQRVDRPENKTP